MPDPIRITDVSPRDGLQNEPRPIPTEDKLRLVLALIDASPDEIEVTSFVSPKWIPQLGDAADLLAMLARRLKETNTTPPMLSALVPNERGLDALLKSNDDAGKGPWGDKLISKASVFTAASETFAQKNTNASIAETIERFRPVIARAKEQGLETRGYISCVIACPFEGPIDPEQVRRVADMLTDLGIDEIDLGDTIGAATERTTAALLESISRTNPQAGHTNTTLHLHDTFGNAASCARTAIDLGVRSFDAAAGGLGGCPYASTPDKRAPGNIDTQTMVFVAREAGFETTINTSKLRDAAGIAQSLKSEEQTP